LDKNKIIEAAGKLVAKGAYDKAIKEYQKILEVDPKDVRILQKMGELYQKKNDNEQAATFIMKVAESYAKDGFFLKAVAQYKQVLKLDPSLIDINVQLAELHQQLQLMGEAMSYYQIVANHYDKQGDVKKSLDVLRKMVDLDPDNVQSRVKLADLYVRERMSDDALAELQRAAEHLKRQSRIDDYLRVAEKITALTPEDLVLARELAEIYLQRNDQKRALAKLQVCFKADPRDIETLRLLVVAFQGLGQTSKTISVYKELARAYAERGQDRESEQTWAHVAQLDPNDPDVQARGAHQARDQVNSTVTQAARTANLGVGGAYGPQSGQQPTTLPPASETRPAANQQPATTPATAVAKPRADSLGKLLTETDVYVKYGLHDKALEHLRKIFAAEPENLDAHEKAYLIYVASNNHAQAADQLLNVLRLLTRVGDRVRAQPYLSTMLEQNPGHPEVPVFVQALGLEDAEGVDGQGLNDEVPEDAILVDSSDDEVIVADEPGEEPVSSEVALSSDEHIDPTEYVSDDNSFESDDAVSAGALEFDSPPLSEEVVDEAPLISDDEIDEPSTNSLMLGAEDSRTGEFESLSSPALESNADPFGEQDDGPTHELSIPLNRGVPVALGDDEHQRPTRTMKAMDPSLAKTATGFASAATAALQASPLELEEVRPSFSGSTMPDEEARPSAWQAPVSPTSDEAVEAPPPEEPASEECDEATFFIEQGLLEEAREILETVLIAYPEHQRAAQLLAQVEAGGVAPEQSGSETEEPSTGESRDAFDLAQELADELGDFGAEQGAPAAQPEGEGDYQVSVEEVFAEFKKGLEKVVKPEDVDTHYDLGIAYKEMGLMDDAISEFTIARKGCVGKKKEIDCLSMAGMLHVMKGDFPMAVDAFMQALTSEHASGEVEKATRFELGMAYEGAGQPGRALAQFLKVQASDPSYREVGAMVDRLSAIAVPEEDPPVGGVQVPKKGGPPAGGSSRKVGYV
jgi:pilus assembly protein FimV